MLFLDQCDSISSKIVAGHAGAEFVPFSSRNKGPWPCTGAYPWPVSSMGPRPQPEFSNDKAAHAGVGAAPLWCPSSFHQTHSSPSPRAGDKLLSEWRISGSLCLKSSEQFLKAQIYILWFWPFFCSFSFLELLPSFMIQAAAHFHLNHSLKHTFSAKPLATDDWIWQKQHLNSEQGFCLSKLFGG